MQLYGCIADSQPINAWCPFQRMPNLFTFSGIFWAFTSQQLHADNKRMVSVVAALLLTSMVIAVSLLYVFTP
jgi:hypothetical protein